VIRSGALAEGGESRFPVIAVNDAMTRHLFDNRYGTGQGSLIRISLFACHFSKMWLSMLTTILNTLKSWIVAG
jgi:hypothetical protein